jgi:hypothetical protein
MKKDPQRVCHTYWSNRAGCKNTELDQNMGTGVPLGPKNISMAETITVRNPATIPSLWYLIYVDDNTATGANLSQVHPVLTMALGRTFVTDEMPPLPSRRRGARFWLAGAVEVVGAKFRYVSAKSWSHETPVDPELIIKDLLVQTKYSTIPAFCETSLVVKVRDALTNQAVNAVTVTVVWLEGGYKQVSQRDWGP